MKMMNRTLWVVALSLCVLACKRAEDGKPMISESKTDDSPASVEVPPQRHPSFELWSKVSVGMTENEVYKLLGKPKSGSLWSSHKRFPVAKNAQYNWSYGSLYPESSSHPFGSDFDVVFAQGRVVRLDDLFGGEPIKSAGLPAVPRLFVPQNNSVFRHYPRILDLRWWASSGSEPITYEVSVEVMDPSGEWHIEQDLQKRVGGLHVSMLFPGANTGRWRVRGWNKEGAGQWSEYRNFDFSQ
ncbi:MAG TPA: hypothetical protein VIM46_06255 [Luteolibacter sp.]